MVCIVISYSADELPAYILVMLDNKRQWTDISQELEVFLVESTEPFVEWLKKEIDRKPPTDRMLPALISLPLEFMSIFCVLPCLLVHVF